MRRTYIKPETAVQAVVMEPVMQSLSGVNGNGMNYGGVDTGGNRTVDAKERDLEWDEM